MARGIHPIITQLVNLGFRICDLRQASGTKTWQNANAWVQGWYWPSGEHLMRLEAALDYELRQRAKKELKDNRLPADNPSVQV